MLLVLLLRPAPSDRPIMAPLDRPRCYRPSPLLPTAPSVPSDGPPLLLTAPGSSHRAVRCPAPPDRPPLLPTALSVPSDGSRVLPTTPLSPRPNNPLPLLPAPQPQAAFQQPI